MKNSKLAVFATTMLMSVASFAAVADDAITVGTDAPPSNTGFMSIVFGGTIVDIGIWMSIFAVSFATLAFIIQGFIAIKREKLIPEALVGSIAESLEAGNLQEA
ncbi:MAG: hypothetical protein KAG98_01090, partial [Lentisphaeria bacterium]|nr:hypothetical protein [Lentisphaeria bacterium]